MNDQQITSILSVAESNGNFSNLPDPGSPEEAISFNPNLSQSYYHLSKYYSLSDQKDKMIIRLEKAIEIDRMYALDVKEEKAFDKNRNHVNQLLDKLRDQNAVISDS